MLRLMDGWFMGSTEKVEWNEKRGRRKKPVNLCLVNLSILSAGGLSPTIRSGGMCTLSARGKFCRSVAQHFPSFSSLISFF